MGFRELVRDQLCVARDAAEANDLLGDVELGQWWRGRVAYLEEVLGDLDPRALEPTASDRAAG